MKQQIFGHNKEKQIFLQAFDMHHAWIFKGSRGIGKATLARFLSLKIFSTIHGNLKPELIARQIENNSYPNFFYLKSENTEKGKIDSIYIDQSRKLINFLHQKQVLPGWRIVCVDALEDLTLQASNALLKILEEPPSQTIFLLITHNYGKVSPVIQSRACKLAFYPLSQSDMEQATSNLQLTHRQFLYDLSMGQPGMYQKFNGLPQDFFKDFKQAFINSMEGKNIKIDKLLHSELEEILLRTIYLVGIKKTKGWDNWCANINFDEWAQRYSAIQKFLLKTQLTHLDPAHKVLAMFLLLKNYDYQMICLNK